jgi:membrane-associated protein
MTEKTTNKIPPTAYVSYGLIAFYVIVIIILRFNIPDTKTLIEMITVLYQKYGYLIVFISGILEALFLVGMYVPGTAAILLGAVVARSGAVSLPLIIFLGTVGMCIGYSINYYMGKHGWYHVLAKFGLEKGIVETEKKMKKYGVKAMFVGYISPNSGSLIATAAGVMKMPFGKFILLSALSQLFWSTVWGLVAYMLGPLFVEIALKYFSIIIWLVIAGWVIWNYVLKKKEGLPN